MVKYKSDRLMLKLLDKDSITDEYVSWHNNKELLKFYSSSGKKFTKDFIIDELKHYQKSNDSFYYGIYYKDDNKLIGNIKIGPISPKHKTSDLVIFIGDINYLGKGLAVEGIKLGNKVSFEEHGIRKLFGGMYKSNIASVKAYTRADWVIEGILKGHYLTDDRAEDRILVACFNPKYFDNVEIAAKALIIEDVYDF